MASSMVVLLVLAQHRAMRNAQAQPLAQLSQDRVPRRTAASAEPLATAKAPELPISLALQFQQAQQLQLLSQN